MPEPFLYLLQNVLKSSEDCRNRLFTYLFFQLFAAFLSSLNLSSEITESHNICKASRLRNVPALKSCLTFTDFIKSQSQKWGWTYFINTGFPKILIFSKVNISEKFNAPRKGFQYRVGGEVGFACRSRCPPTPQKEVDLPFFVCIFFFFLDLFLPQG